MKAPVTVAEYEEAYKVIHGVLGQFVFTPPVELQDCEIVRNALLAALPGFRVGVCHRCTQVAVQIYAPNGLKIFDWNKPVKAAT